MASKTATIKEWKEQLKTDDHWAVRALLRIYQEQTIDERSSHITRYANSVGFTAFDAEFLTSLAEQYDQGRMLTDKQMSALHKIIPKYAGQLYRLTYEQKEVA